MLLAIAVTALIAFSSICIVRTDSSPSDQVIDEESRLHKHLFCAYDAKHRPGSNNRSEKVEVRINLKHIKFNPIEQIVTVHTDLTMKWNDDLLKWSPSKYDRIQEIQVKVHELWVPKMAFFSTNSMTVPKGYRPVCSVTSEGNVSCVLHIYHSVICRTLLRHWPFDSQNCTVYFGSWMHNAEVNYTFFVDQIFQYPYRGDGGWKLWTVARNEVPTEVDNREMLIHTLNFVLRKDASVSEVVVSSSIIILLTIISLLLDINDNVRLTIACFSLFGHFMFLTEIGYDIPEQSEDTPYIFLFVRDSMILTLVVIFLTLVLMSLRRSSVPPPTWLVSMTRFCESSLVKYIVVTKFDSNIVDDVGAVSNKEWIQIADLVNSCVFIVTVLVYIMLFCFYIPYRD